MLWGNVLKDPGLKMWVCMDLVDPMLIQKAFHQRRPHHQYDTVGRRMHTVPRKMMPRGWADDLFWWMIVTIYWFDYPHNGMLEIQILLVFYLRIQLLNNSNPFHS